MHSGCQGQLVSTSSSNAVLHWYDSLYSLLYWLVQINTGFSLRPCTFHQLLFMLFAPSEPHSFNTLWHTFSLINSSHNIFNNPVWIKSSVSEQEGVLMVRVNKILPTSTQGTHLQYSLEATGFYQHCTSMCWFALMFFSFKKITSNITHLKWFIGSLFHLS